MDNSSNCNHSYSKKANQSFRDLCNDSYMDGLSERIKQLHALTGMTPEAYAKTMKVSRPAFLKWVSGETTNIKLSNLKRICEYHSISLEELLLGKDADSKKVNIKDIADSWPFAVDRKKFNRMPKDRRQEIDRYLTYIYSTWEQGEKKVS